MAPTISKSCDSLLVSSNGPSGPSSVYPYYTTGGVLNLGSDDTKDGYWRSTLRTSYYESALSQDIATECLSHGAVYSFSAQVRVIDSVEERQVQFTLDSTEGRDVIVTCPPSANNEWVLCQGNYRVSAEETFTSPRLYTHVLGDDSSTVDIADVSFSYNGGRTTGLILEDTTNIDCWGPGAEVLIVSF